MSWGRLRRQVETLWTLVTARGPVYVILYLTSSCNFRCPMCFYLDEINDSSKEELSLPELEKLARSLGRLAQLSLTGGEPFLRKDIPEIVTLFSKHNRVSFVTIPTNGWMTDRIAHTVERLVAAHPDIHFRIPLSLDGFPEDHDRIRRRGSFQKIERTAERLVDIRGHVGNLTVDINTCYSVLNQGKVDGLVDFVAERFDVDNHTITYVRGHADEATKHASVSEYARLVEDLRRRRERRESRPFSSLLRAVMDYQRDIIRWTLQEDRMFVPCAAGKKLIVVNEKGEVLPCEILSGKLGNLEDHDFDARRVLETEQARKQIDWIRDTKCHCTFECALATSIIYHKAGYPRVFRRALREWLRLGPRRSRCSDCFPDACETPVPSIPGFTRSG